MKDWEIFSIDKMKEQPFAEIRDRVTKPFKRILMDMMIPIQLVSFPAASLLSIPFLKLNDENISKIVAA